MERFNEFLEARMRVEGIADRAELSRLSDVDQTQLSNWRRGKSQPSRGSLKKIAAVIHASPASLYLMAGLDEPSDLEMKSGLDMRQIPDALNELIDLYNSSSVNDDERRVLLIQARSAALTVREMVADRLAPERPRASRRSA